VTLDRVIFDRRLGGRRSKLKERGGSGLLLGHWTTFNSKGRDLEPSNEGNRGPVIAKIGPSRHRLAHQDIGGDCTRDVDMLYQSHWPQRGIPKIE
jgi:hypothetical protein